MDALFILLLVLGLVAWLVWVGYVLAQEELAEERVVVEQQRQALDVEWQALENGRRVNDVFFHARAAMREVEREQRPRP